jgi:hypothetical protein
MSPPARRPWSEFSRHLRLSQRAEQCGNGYPEDTGQIRQHRNGDAQTSDFVVCERLLRDSQRIGELLLRQVPVLSQLCEACSQHFVELLLVRRHRVESPGGSSREHTRFARKWS